MGIAIVLEILVHDIRVAALFGLGCRASMWFRMRVSN